MMQMEVRLSEAAEEHPLAEERLNGLHVLVGELLKANQELRFKVALLERQSENMESGLKSANA
jgi:hypothetical protein